MIILFLLTWIGSIVIALFLKKANNFLKDSVGLVLLVPYFIGWKPLFSALGIEEQNPVNIFIYALLGVVISFAITILISRLLFKPRHD